MPNGIDLILADHRRVEALFSSFADTGEATYVGQIVDALAMHDQAEHSALYPLAGHVLGDADLIERSAAAHSLVKTLIDRLLHLEGAPLVEAVSELAEAVNRHVQDEEQHLLPALQEACSPAQLDGLGARIEQTKQRVG
jgi:hemerythrin superfamily protein